MLIPKSIKIGAFNLEVREVKGLADDGSLSGEGTILINKDLSPKEKELTLFHEIIHCINPGFTEKEVEWISRALYQVFKDNNFIK